MTLRRFGFIVIGLLTTLAVIAGVAIWGITRTPEFYQAELARPHDPVVRREQAKAFEKRAEKLAEEVRQADRWQHEFDQDQINAWLAVELSRRFGDALPAGIHDPRVLLQTNVANVAFQVEDPGTHVKTVVSLKLRPVLSAPNRLDVTIESVRAGIVPVPVDNILDQAVSRLNEHGWKVERTRRGPDDVFQIELDRVLPPGATLQALALKPGRVTVEGRGADGASPQVPAQSPEGVLESSAADELDPSSATPGSPDAGDASNGSASQDARH